MLFCAGNCHMIRSLHRQITNNSIKLVTRLLPHRPRFTRSLQFCEAVHMCATTAMVAATAIKVTSFIGY